MLPQRHAEDARYFAACRYAAFMRRYAIR